MKVELIIENNGVIYNPVVLEGITWETERKGAPGILKFDIAKVGTINITEGNPVRLKINDTDVFYGFIFIKSRNKDNVISITAYDQLRYFKNKDTYVYENQTAGEFIKTLADDFRLNTGTLEDTSYKIPSRVEKNATLFDMVQNALDLTVEHKKELYVLYDDFGKLTLKSIANMKVNLVVCDENAENFDYKSSIDSDTYNMIKLFNKDEANASKKVTIAKSEVNIGKWGVLQYFDTIEDNENAQAKANALLSLYNRKTRSLSIRKCFGDLRVRAGSMVIVKLNLGDVALSNYMLVEKCKHTFNESEHFMDLTVRGGEFNA